MLSVRKQLILCLLFFALTVGIVVMVMKHFDANSRIQSSESFLHDTYMEHFALNVIVFFATMVSTSRHALLFLVDRMMKGKVSPFIVSLMNVFINVACLALFDFRIIHVAGRSKSMRSSILFADIASFMFEEATRLF